MRTPIPREAPRAERRRAARARRDAPLITFYDAMNDPHIFGPWFAGPSWDRWRVWAKAVEGLPMTEAELELFRHHTGREHPPTSAATEAWNVSARRTGKSLIAAAYAVFTAAFRDYRRFVKPGERPTAMILAADREQAGVVFKYGEAFFDTIPLLVPLVASRTKDSIDLTNGVTITVQTASFRRLRGRTVVSAILDEIAFWQSDETSANPDREILAALRPSMATIPNAVLIAISSPHARRGTLWTAFQNHFAKTDDPVLVWKGTTAEMNPTLDLRVIEEAYATDPAAARAEWGAEFRSDIETYLATEWIDAVVVPNRRELPPRDGVRYLAACDPSGGAGGDYFTWAICHVEGVDGQRKVVLDLLRGHRPRGGGDIDLESVVKEIVVTLRHYRISRICGDRYASQWVVESFKREGIRYEEPRLRALNDPDAEPKYVDKSAAYAELEPLIATARVELLDHEVLVRELKGLERRLRAGKPLIDHMPGGHDDFSNSAALVLVLAARQRIRPMVYSPAPQIGERIGERGGSGAAGGAVGGQARHVVAGGIAVGQAVQVMRRWNR